ncbi:hypothetical protein [Kibdelosporangium aridum]|uniref:hypothetical protein n=1 Tax=Kibdelosporangium aridum TaxID=2030 RepID=UPI0035EF89F6
MTVQVCFDQINGPRDTRGVRHSLAAMPTTAGVRRWEPQYIQAIPDWARTGPRWL